MEYVMMIVKIVDMEERKMKIENLRVYGLEESVLASGYPMYKYTLSEEEFNSRADKIAWDIALVEEFDKELTPDIFRASNLGNTPIGSGHSQFLIGVIAQFDLEIPIKVWTEAQRYHFLDFVSSMSTMHKLKDLLIYCI